MGIKKEILYYDFFEFKENYYLVAVTEQGLSFVSSDDNQFYEFSSFYPQKMLIKDSTKVRPYLTQIVEYLQHKRKKFTIPIDILDFGTPLQKEVFRTVMKIPYGRTMTLGTITAALGVNGRTREVRHALALNPILIVIPTHRVVLSAKKLGIFRGGPELHAALIELEREPRES